MQLYGETTSEREAKKIQQCRDIVQEVMRFGVTQAQIVRICHLLALELENRQAMLDVTGMTKKHLSSIDTGEVEQSGLIT